MEPYAVGPILPKMFYHLLPPTAAFRPVELECIFPSKWPYFDFPSLPCCILMRLEILEWEFYTENDFL